jgi:flagellar basal body rod protein FlgC
MDLVRPLASICSMSSSSFDPQKHRLDQRNSNMAEWIAHQVTEAFPYMRHRTALPAIGTASMAPSSHADCTPWAFGTNPSQQRRIGKIAQHG